MDASSLMHKGCAQNYLDPEHAEQIAAWANQFEEIQDRARVVASSQIKEEDWTLNISGYVLPLIGERSKSVPPLDVPIQDFKSAWGRAQEAKAKLRDIMKENGLLDQEQ